MIEITHAEALTLFNAHWSPGNIPQGRFWRGTAREEAEQVDYDVLFGFRPAEGEDCFLACQWERAPVQLSLFGDT